MRFHCLVRIVKQHWKGFSFRHSCQPGVILVGGLIFLIIVCNCRLEANGYTILRLSIIETGLYFSSADMSSTRKGDFLLVAVFLLTLDWLRVFSRAWRSGKIWWVLVLPGIPLSPFANLTLMQCYFPFTTSSKPSMLSLLCHLSHTLVAILQWTSMLWSWFNKVHYVLPN